MMSDYPKITYRKHTFLSALVFGICAIIIALIVSLTVVVIYAMDFAGDKSEQIVELVQSAVQGLPPLQKSLPPALADVLADRRQPDYSSQLDVTAKTETTPEQSGRIRTSVTVINNGQQVVSLLSLRVVILNSDGEVVDESNELAATPFAADDDWRGPILPGAHRYFSCSHNAPRNASTESLKTEVEITDIRIWSGVQDESGTETPSPAESQSAPAPQI